MRNIKRQKSFRQDVKNKIGGSAVIQRFSECEPAQTIKH